MKNKKYLITTVIVVASLIGGLFYTQSTKETQLVQQALSTQTASPDYIIISRSELMSLPMSGDAWNSIMIRADGSRTPNICNQDDNSNINALASGIVYARTGNLAYRDKTINLIQRMMASQKDGCYNAVLAMGRQLGGWVLAADFANYRDPVFTSWLNNILDREIGGHGRWHVLRFTAYDSASNWGIHALASVTTADIYLNNEGNIEKDWKAFSGYGKPFGHPFNKASSFNEQWSCVPTDPSNKGKLPIAINPVGCVKGGINLDGAPVEDSSRSSFGSYSTYIHESMQGYAVMAQLFERTGRNGWTVNESQICRAIQFGNRVGRLNDSSVSYFVSYMGNEFCGLSLPTKSPTSNGRMFAFSDWLYSGSGETVITVTPSLASPSATVTNIVVTKSATPTKTPTSTVTVTKTPTATNTVVPNTPTASETSIPMTTPYGCFQDSKLKICYWIIP